MISLILRIVLELIVIIDAKERADECQHLAEGNENGVVDYAGGRNTEAGDEQPDSDGSQNCRRCKLQNIFTIFFRFHFVEIEEMVIFVLSQMLQFNVVVGFHIDNAGTKCFKLPDREVFMMLIHIFFL